MKSILFQKATLSFNITNNKMNTKIFQDYQNSGLYFTLQEVRDRIEELTSDIRGSVSFYRRRQSGVLTKTQKQQLFVENETQDEIDFWERQIYGFENEEDVQKHVEEMTSFHFNNHQETEDEAEENKDKEPYYHINDYCDPYLGRASPPIPEFDSSDEEDEEEERQIPPAKIDDLEKKLDGVENVVYQLLGGLFNQRTQSDMIESHLCRLRGNEYPGEVNKDTSIWPTTRQGDKNEEEIQLLKHQVSKLEGTVQILIQLLAEKVKN
jgi:hypothetical protein